MTEHATAASPVQAVNRDSARPAVGDSDWVVSVVTAGFLYHAQQTGQQTRLDAAEKARRVGRFHRLLC